MTVTAAVICRVNIKIEMMLPTFLSQQEESRFPFKDHQGGLLIGPIPEDSLTIKKHHGGGNWCLQHAAENGPQPRGSY